MRVSRRTRDHAKQLRQPMSRAEVILWTRLKGRQLLGFQFRKQHPIEPYIVDFACVQARLVIEVDGATHSTPEERAYVERRSAFLEEEGWTVLREWNDEVCRNEQGVVDAIARHVTELMGGRR